MPYRQFLTLFNILLTCIRFNMWCRDVIAEWQEIYHPITIRFICDDIFLSLHCNWERAFAIIWEQQWRRVPLSPQTLIWDSTKHCIRAIDIALISAFMSTREGAENSTYKTDCMLSTEREGSKNVALCYANEKKKYQRGDWYGAASCIQRRPLRYVSVPS